MADILRDIYSVAIELDPEPVLRVAEVFSSLLSWTVLAAAHRAGYGGAYEYDSYTNLKFLLTASILHCLFALGIALLKRSKSVVDSDTFEKIELYGSALSLLLIYSGALAGAAASTQNHDEFGEHDNSICHPRPHANESEKRKADYFCSHVSAAVTFSFFAVFASTGSLILVILSQRRGGLARNGGGGDPDAYNPIDSPAPEGVPGVTDQSRFFGTQSFQSSGLNPNRVPMEAISSDANQPQKLAAMDL
mmetsp:Transcript_3916/g.5476  ORF Transcript_3916/g.5476 Transcript_3916/m.5476 type:complete len:249 (-) Transcript_3916:242-988(-)